jgi:hypothetical protein
MLTFFYPLKEMKETNGVLSVTIWQRYWKWRNIKRLAICV